MVRVDARAWVDRAGRPGVAVSEEKLAILSTAQKMDEARAFAEELLRPVFDKIEERQRHLEAALAIARKHREESTAWDDVCVLLGG